MDAKKIRTRQETYVATNPRGTDYVIGLDVGYSGTKVFYENGYFCIPSYAKKVEGMINIPDHKDIFYRNDETGEIYLVGYNAQKMVESTNTNDTDGELYSRKRYTDRRFRILCHTAIGLATRNKQDGRDIFIQTGLPSSYISGDTPALKKALTTPARFSLKVGAGPWQSCSYEIQEGKIGVMPQPMGALYSAIIKNDGHYTANAKEMLSGNVLVLDIGFGTFDFFGIKNRAVTCVESTDDLGMREVLSRVSRKIMVKYHEDVRVSALQNSLETGTITCINEEEMRSEEREIGPLIQEASQEVLAEVLEKTKSVTNMFRGYRYLIVDGGAGEAWYEEIRAWLSNMNTLKVLPCNFNDHLPFIYSNARGYYMFGYTSHAGREG